MRQRNESTAIRILRFIARRLEEKGLPRTNVLARCITLYSLHDAMRVAILSRRLRSCVNIFDTLQFYEAFTYNFQLQRECMFTFSINRHHSCLWNFIVSWTRLKKPNRNSFRPRNTTRTLHLCAFKFPTNAQTFRAVHWSLLLNILDISYFYRSFIHFL